MYSLQPREEFLKGRFLGRNFQKSFREESMMAINTFPKT